MKKILVSWDEFCNSLNWSELVKVYHNSFHRFYERDQINLNPSSFSFFNGPIEEWKMLKEDNENIERIDGQYILQYRKYDQEEIEPDWDGYPQFKNLETYTLAPCRLQFWTPI